MKNLENEYKKITENDVPDLWSRIEAGIDELEKDIPSDKKDITDTKIVKFEANKKSIKKYIPIIATAAVLMLSVGVYMIGNTKHYDSNMTAMSDSSYEAAATCEESAMEEPEMYADMEMEESEASSDVSWEEVQDTSEAVVEEPQVNSGAAMKKSNPVYEQYGVITATDDENVFSITTDEGEIIKLYIPSEYLNIAKAAAADNTSLYINYEEIDEKISGDYSINTEDVKYIVIYLTP